MMKSTPMERLQALVRRSGDVADDSALLLRGLGHHRTCRHSMAVAARAVTLARQFEADEQAAAAAAWLHDISVVIPDDERVQVAETWGMAVFPEEREHPMLLHQRQSAILARDLFGVQDEGVLQAIACHTTLQAGASGLAKVLFVADKLAWDQDGLPPYAHAMEAALQISLDRAALVYIQWLHEHRATLRAVHPWLIEAYQELTASQW